MPDRPHPVVRFPAGSPCTTLSINIHNESEPGWILEVFDEENASTIRDDPFDTDQEALNAVLTFIEQDGIRSFLDSEYETMQ